MTGNNTSSDHQYSFLIHHLVATRIAYATVEHSNTLIFSFISLTIVVLEHSNALMFSSIRLNCGGRAH